MLKALGHKLRCISLLKLFVIIFLAVLLIIISLGIFRNNYNRNDKMSSTIQNFDLLNGSAASKIHDYFTDIKSLSTLPTEEFHYFSEFNQKTDDRTKMLIKDNFDQIALKMLNYKDSIHSVFLFNQQGKSEYKIKGSALQGEGLNALNAPWFEQAIQSNGTATIVDTFLLPNLVTTNLNRSYVFSVVRMVYNIFDPEDYAVVMINCDISFLEKICQELTLTPEQQIYIVSRDGNIIYHKDPQSLTFPIPQEISDALSQPEENPIITLDGMEFLVCTQPCKGVDWEIVNLIPLEYINHPIEQSARIDSLIVLLMLLSWLAVFLILYMMILKPIKKLTIIMRLGESGDLNVQMKYRGTNEIGKLSNGFNNLIQQIQNLIANEYESKLRQKDLQLKWMQNQINPHFLYNALESIRMLTESKQDYETARMITALGAIARYSNRTYKELVPVSEEIKQLQNYISLQTACHPGKFQAYTDVPDSALKYKMLKFILQPIVENAITHGISGMEKNGQIRISAKAGDGLLIFRISDNGLGMTPEKLAQLTECTETEGGSDQNIGLTNVSNRIKLYYGEEYGLSFESEVNVGTTVTVRLPLL